MKRLYYELAESLRIALAQIRANKMRSILTALGVIIGIVSVTLMSTAILGIDRFVENSFSGFGDDVFYVTKWPWRDVDDWWSYRNRPAIKADYAREIVRDTGFLVCAVWLVVCPVSRFSLDSWLRTPVEKEL
jgi:putative ABC transport system permease protein